MNLLLNLVPLPYRLLALAALAAALMGFGWVKGAEHGEAKLNAYKVAEQKLFDAQVAKAGQTTADLKSDALILEGVKNDEIKAITGRLTAALADGVRLRAARRPVNPNAPAACAGANGAELAGGDAGFLSRFAAAAATQQAELNTCIGNYNAAKTALDRLKAPPGFKLGRPDSIWAK